jgi:hypothetical protein
VLTIGDALEALLDDAKERIERLEVVEVGDRRRHDVHSECLMIGSAGARQEFK